MDCEKISTIWNTSKSSLQTIRSVLFHSVCDYLSILRFIPLLMCNVYNGRNLKSFNVACFGWEDEYFQPLASQSELFYFVLFEGSTKDTNSVDDQDSKLLPLWFVVLHSLFHRNWLLPPTLWRLLAFANRFGAKFNYFLHFFYLKWEWFTNQDFGIQCNTLCLKICLRLGNSSVLWILNHVPTTIPRKITTMFYKNPTLVHTSNIFTYVRHSPTDLDGYSIHSE